MRNLQNVKILIKFLTFGFMDFSETEHYFDSAG